jgi:hypothetical protein
MVTYRWPVVASLGAVLALGGAAPSATGLAPLLGPRLARADSTRLAEARRAIEDVRYDRAEELLGAALRDGGNAPETVQEIYKLAASTAVVLGKEELGEQYYRRLLSLNPRATLDEGVAPKLKRPFVAAQAHVNAHGALRARTRRAGDTVEIVVENDPLTMVTAVALRGARGKAARLSPEGRAVIELEPGKHEDDARLVLLDELGNQLQVLPVPAAEVALPAPPPGAPPSEAGAARPSLLRSWWLWTVPAGVSLGVGVVTGLQSRQASQDLDDLLASPAPYYSDAEELRQRSRQRATIANISFAAAGVFAIVAGVMLIQQPAGKKPAATALLPMLGGDGSVGVSLSGHL